MKYLTQIGLACGLALLLGLILWQGVVAVLQLLFSSGWALLWLPVVWLPNLLPATQAWRVLFPPQDRPAFAKALAAMWMARAVNNLFPVANLGGEIVKARLTFVWGTDGSTAAASVIVDKTMQVIAVIVWGLFGAGLLAYLSSERQLVMLAFAGFLVLTLAVAGFFFAQQAGMFGFLARQGGKFIKTDSWAGITASAHEIDRVVRVIYGRKKAVLFAVLLKPLGLMLQSIEVWLACYLLGQPIGVLEALMLRSLTSTLSDVAFVIPNAYGIQEGAFIIIGAAIGLGPDLALALSLALRIRDIILDPAGVLVLHRIESRRWFSRTRTS